MKTFLLILFLVCCATVGIADSATVDPDDPAGIAAIYKPGQNYYALSTSGEVFALIFNYGDPSWEAQTDIGLPTGIEVSDLASWFVNSYRLHDGSFWHYYTDGVWIEIPTLPNNPVSSQSQSVSNIRALYR